MNAGVSYAIAIENVFGSSALEPSTTTSTRESMSTDPDIDPDQDLQQLQLEQLRGRGRHPKFQAEIGFAPLVRTRIRTCIHVHVRAYTKHQQPDVHFK